MLILDQISCVFGGNAILRDVSCRVRPGERIAIVGPNGAGKSTVLRIAAGRIRPDSGAVSYPKKSLVGYLPQEPDLESERTLREELKTVFEPVLRSFAEMEKLEIQMADADAPEDLERISRRYDFLQGEIQRLDAFSIDSEIGKTSAGLGFSASDLDRSCREFSGGWRTRIVLAKLLLEQPDILLLDEPTNHLDIESMLWLENWIRSSRASVIMVSHERAFMDRLVSGVLELANGEGVFYKGNHARYLSLRSARREQQQSAYENQQKKIREIEKFIARFRYNAAKSSLVQSRIKQMEKVEILSPPPPDPSAIHFRFPASQRVNKIVLELKAASKMYGDLEALKPTDLTICRGERVALVGPNGAGKSTLLKLLAGTEEPSSGAVETGSQAIVEYFEQQQTELLSARHSVLEEMSSASPLDNAVSSRDILGAFLFRGDDVDKQVRVLSGGEKTRLRLAKMLYSKANCLLLDEPTNHLDLASRMTLEGALIDFSGAIVFVSHDRVFLNRVATRIVEVREGSIRSYPGNFADYLKSTDGHGFLPDGELMPAERQSEDAALDAGESKGQRVAKHKERKAAARKQKALEREVAALERDIERFEQSVEDIHARMAEPETATNPERLGKLAREQSEAAQALAEATRAWERKSENLEKFESE
jgi:ATP-binding cassette subfamily F protein 3